MNSPINSRMDSLDASVGKVAKRRCLKQRHWNKYRRVHRPLTVKETCQKSNQRIITTSPSITKLTFHLVHYQWLGSDINTNQGRFSAILTSTDNITINSCPVSPAPGQSCRIGWPAIATGNAAAIAAIKCSVSETETDPRNSEKRRVRAGNRPQLW